MVGLVMLVRSFMLLLIICHVNGGNINTPSSFIDKFISSFINNQGKYYNEQM